MKVCSLFSFVGIRFAAFSLFALFSGLSYSSEVHYLVVEKQTRPLQIEHYGQGHKGIVTEVVLEVFKDRDYQLSMHTMPFPEVVSAMEASYFDNWIGLGSSQWGGVLAENMTDEPIITVSHTLLTVKEGGFTYRSVDDLDDKVVILLEGFDYPGLESYIETGKIQELRVKSYEVAFKLLSRLKSKACFVEMDLRIKYNMARNDIAREDYVFNDFSSVIADYNVHFTLDPKSPKELKSFVDARIKEMKSQGKIEAISSSYQ